MATYRLLIEYDGTRYHGWQEQQNAPSVAGAIRRSAVEIVDLVDLVGSGRTDAGVHALAQSAHLRVRAPVEPEALRRGLNDRLPSDIHVLSVSPVGDHFHARHSAVARSYLYQVSLRRTAFAKRYVWWVKRPLRIDRIEEAAVLLVGRHDFAAFCERPAEQASTVVVLERAEIAVRGSLVLVRLVASHFLWKMVRRLVGTLVKIGAGEIEIEVLKSLLSREAAAVEAFHPAEWTAPAAGLFLERVLYEGDDPPGELAPAFPVLAEPERSAEVVSWSAPAPEPPRRPRPPKTTRRGRA